MSAVDLTKIVDGLVGLETRAAADVGPRVLAFDTFDRADGSLGTSDSGHAWNSLVGSWEVVGNVAKQTGTDNPSLAVLPVGQVSASVEVTSKCGALARQVGVLWAVDASNYIVAEYRQDNGRLRIAKSVAGTVTELAGTADTHNVAEVYTRMWAAVMDTGSELRIVAFAPHSERVSAEESTDYAALSGATDVGIKGGHDSSHFDNLVIREST